MLDTRFIEKGIKTEVNISYIKTETFVFTNHEYKDQISYQKLGGMEAKSDIIQGNLLKGNYMVVKKNL